MMRLVQHTALDTLRGTISPDKAEAPNIESLRWLRMFGEALRIKQDRIMGAVITRARVDVRNVAKWGGARLWLSTADGVTRCFTVPTAAINNRDTKWILRGIMEQMDADLVFAENHIVKAIRQ